MINSKDLEGKAAPEFALPDQDGTEHSLAQYRGQWVLLYFYPKDDTAGCTAEACGVRDSMEEFKNLSCTVLGVSTDSVASHKEFAEKYSLTFTLLADEEKKAVELYGVWGTRKFMGREYTGTARTSFLINPEGTVVRVYENVNPEKHSEQALKDLAELR